MILMLSWLGMILELISKRDVQEIYSLNFSNSTFLKPKWYQSEKKYIPEQNDMQLILYLYFIIGRTILKNIFFK